MLPCQRNYAVVTGCKVLWPPPTSTDYSTSSLSFYQHCWADVHNTSPLASIGEQLPHTFQKTSCCFCFFLHPQPPLCLIWPVNSSNRMEQYYVQINLLPLASELALGFCLFNGWSSWMLKWISIAHNSPNSSAWQSVHPVFFDRNGGHGWGGRVGCTLTRRLDGSNPQCPHAEVSLYWTPMGRSLRGSSQCTWVCSG